MHQRTMAEAQALNANQRSPQSQSHAHPGPRTRAIRVPRRGNTARTGFRLRGRGRGSRRGASSRDNNPNNNPDVNLLRIDSPANPLLNPLRDSVDDPYSLWSRQQLELQDAHSREIHRIKNLCKWPGRKHHNPLRVSRETDSDQLAGLSCPYPGRRKKSQSADALSTVSSHECWSGLDETPHTATKKPRIEVPDSADKCAVHEPKARRNRELARDLLCLVEQAARESQNRVPGNDPYTLDRQPVLPALKNSPGVNGNGSDAGDLDWVDGPGRGDGSEDDYNEASDHGHGGEGDEDANEPQDGEDESEQDSDENEGERSSDENSSPSWTGFERGLYMPTASENQRNFRPRSAPPAMETVRADRNHRNRFDRHYGIGGFRIVELAVDTMRGQHNSASSANSSSSSNSSADERPPTPYPPHLAIRTNVDDDDDDDSGYERFPDIDPAILYIGLDEYIGINTGDPSSSSANNTDAPHNGAQPDSNSAQHEEVSSSTNSDDELQAVSQPASIPQQQEEVSALVDNVDGPQTIAERRSSSNQNEEVPTSSNHAEESQIVVPVESNSQPHEEDSSPANDADATHDITPAESNSQQHEGGSGPANITDERQTIAQTNSVSQQNGTVEDEN